MNEFDPLRQQNEAAVPPVSPGAVPPVAPRKPRRVGTLTMGLALIGTGLLIAAAMFAPAIDLTLALRLCPLLLVLLGCEVIFFSLRGKEEKVKYDWFSMFLCFVLVVGSLGLATVPKLLQYYGPDRERTESRLTRELNENCYTLLASENIVSDCTGTVYFQGWDFSPDASLELLRSDPDATFSSLEISLSGSYAQGDKLAFAKDAARVLTAMQQSGYPVDRLNFRWTSPSDAAHHEMYLEISNRFALNKTPEKLAEMVTESYADPQAEEDSATYQSGYDTGYSEGYARAQQELSDAASSSVSSEAA